MNNTCKHLFLFGLFVFSAVRLIAFPVTGFTNASTKPLCFIENRGQITDQNSNARPDIQFTIKAAPGLTIFIGSGAIHYQFSRSSSICTEAGPPCPIPISKLQIPQEASFTMYRMDAELIGANKNAKIITEQKQDYYENYFTNWSGEDGTIAYAYAKITYKDIYPNIDWVLYTANGQLEHEFVVHQGGKVSDIRLKYGGATNLQINEDGSMTATTTQGAVTEKAPESRQEDGKKVWSTFVMQDDIISYSTDEYNGDLIIDPTLKWATYYGGSGDEISIGVAKDEGGNVYLSGYTSSTSSIATTGAYQTVYAGGAYDAYTAKFSNAGALLWATYIGGSAFDAAMAITIDRVGNIYMAGYTKSLSGIATPGAYQTANGGSFDAFLVRFSSTGAVLWSTYFGGAGWEEGVGICTDTAGYVYLTGETTSLTAIATSGAYQTVFGGGIYDGDAFLAKFDSSGNIHWSTYLGGSNDDAGYSVVADSSGSVYMVGFTGSTSGIATPGSFQAVYGGGYYDAFLSKFSNTGAMQWSTYYGGTDEDQAFAVTISNTGKILVAGSAASTASIATPGAHQTAFGGGPSDAYLAEFTSAGILQWATYYGGNDLDIGYGVVTDTAGNIYLAGTTASTNAIATTGSFQTSPGGYFDAFLAEFSNTGALKVATYYGGTGNDICSSMALGDSAFVYIAGYTGSTSHIATPGACQTTNSGGLYDAFLAKFNFCTPPVVAAVSGLSKVCQGYIITLTDSTPGGVWGSSNSVVAPVGSASGTVTGIATGIVTISYTVINSCGDTTVRTHTDSVINGPVCHVGTPEIVAGSNNDLCIIPNPNNGHFTLNVISPADEEVLITITDIIGRKVKEFATTTNKMTEIYIGEIAGIYLVSASTATFSFLTRLIIY